MRKKIENEFRNYDNFDEAMAAVVKNYQLPVELNHRFKVFKIMVGTIGWEKEKDDVTFFIWENIPSSNAIKIADELAAILGHKEAYFELDEVAFGGAEEILLTWVIEKSVDWAAGKCLMYLYEKFTDPKVISLTERLRKETAFQNKNGKLHITINPDGKDILNEIVIEVVGYPNLKTNLTLQSIKDLTNQILENPNCTNYIYTKEGVFKEGSCPGKHICVDI